MKFLFDLFPVILFFAMYRWGDANQAIAQNLANQSLATFVSGGAISAAQAPVLLATALAILASVGQIGYLLVRRKKIDTMLWVSFFVIAVFGGATIYFNDPTFIKLKPTALYWCYALALLFSTLLLKKNAIRSMLEGQISLPDFVWQRLNIAWIGFFFAMGFINLFVAFVLFKDNLTAFVNFKVFGAPGLMFAFMFCQVFFLSKYMEEPK